MIIIEFLRKKDNFTSYNIYEEVVKLCNRLIAFLNETNQNKEGKWLINGFLNFDHQANECRPPTQFIYVRNRGDGKAFTST